MVNTVVLSLDRYPPPPESEQIVINTLNYFFTAAFTAELVFKLIGLGFMNYVSDSFNILDAVVVLFSLIELSLANGGNVVSSLRALRLLRVMKLARQWESLRLLINSIMHTLSSIGTFTILLALFIYVAALMGMQFFAGAVPGPPRANFNSLQHAIITIFIVLVGENWNEVMFHTVYAVGWGAAIYFCCLVVLGNFIILNLFLAILLGNFDEARAIMNNIKKLEKELLRQSRRHGRLHTLNLQQSSNRLVQKKLQKPRKKFSQILNKKLTEYVSESSNRLDFQAQAQSIKTPTSEELSNYSKIREDSNLNVKSRTAHIRLVKTEYVEDPSDDTSIKQTRNNRTVGLPSLRLKGLQNLSHFQPTSSCGKKLQSRGSLRDPLVLNVASSRPLNMQSTSRLGSPSNSDRKSEKPNEEEFKEFTESFFLNKSKNNLPTYEDYEIRNREISQNRISTLEKGRVEDSLEIEEELPTPAPSKHAKRLSSHLLALPPITQHGESAKKAKSHQRSISMFRLSKEIMPPRQEFSESLSREESKLEKQKSPTPLSDENKTQDSRVESTPNPHQLSREVAPQSIEKSQESPPDKSSFKFPLSSSSGKLRIKKTCCQYLQECSLFMFHKDSAFRQFIISFTLPPILKKGLNKQKGFTISEVDDEEYFHSRKSSDTKTIFSQDLQQVNKETKAEKGFFSDNEEPASTERKLKNETSLFRFNKSEVSQSVVHSIKRKDNRQKESDQYKKLKRRNSIFEYLVLLLIIASSITIAIDNPLNNPNSRLSKVLFVVDSIFTFLFLLEAILKIIATGFFTSSINRKPYMCNGWNILDFVVVVSSLIDFTLGVAGISTSTLKALKALRTIRALRPLRVISRNQGLKLVVNALIYSIPPMINVLMVCLLFVFIFAILGTNFFKGTFFSCDSESQASQKDCAPQSWKNAMSHFDTTLDAMLTLFEMLNLEGWTDVMWNGIDSTGIGLAPKIDNNLWYALYFIAFIIVGNMFLLNLFVGVVIDNFNQMKEKLGGYFWLTSEQKKWVEVQRLMIRMKLKFLVKPPQNKCRKSAYKLVSSSLFQWFIVLCIVVNSVVMALIHYRIDPKFQAVLEGFNYFFAIVFNIECIAKLLGLGCSYFSSKWNIFDFIIVIGTNAGLIFKIAGSGINIGAAATGVRAFRIMRVIRLVNQSKHLRVILDTLVYILPSLANIGSMICLLIFIYSVLGMYIFAQVKYRPEGIGQMRDYANFRTFGSAMLLLFRCATGESWNLLMHELADSSQPCLSSQTYEDRQRDGIQGCGSAFAYPFFISFMVLISLMIMNLFVAVVIEGFEESRKDDEDSIINSRQLETFLEKWSLYDPKAKGWIRPVDLAFLLHDIEMPLGYMSPNERISLHLNRKDKIKRMKKTMKKLKKQGQKELKSLSRQISMNRNSELDKHLKQRFSERQLQMTRDLKDMKKQIKQLQNFKEAKARNRFEFQVENDWTDRSVNDIEVPGSQHLRPSHFNKKSNFHRQRKVAPFQQDLSISRERVDVSPRLEPHQPRQNLCFSFSESKQIEKRPTSDRMPFQSFEVEKFQKDPKTGKIIHHSRQSSQKSMSQLSFTNKPQRKDKRAGSNLKYSESAYVTNFGEQVLQKGNLLINLHTNVCVEKKRIKEILRELQLFVYEQKNGNYIHIRDVLIALSKKVASQKLGKESLEIDNLKMELKLDKAWTRKYPELEKSKKNKFGNSERFWAAVTIYNAVSKWMLQKKMKRLVEMAQSQETSRLTKERLVQRKNQKKKTNLERASSIQWNLKPKRLEPMQKRERHHSLQNNISLSNTLLRSLEQSAIDSGKRGSQEVQKKNASGQPQ